MMSCLLLLFYAVPGPSDGSLENTPDAIFQWAGCCFSLTTYFCLLLASFFLVFVSASALSRLSQSPVILLATLTNAVSIAFFNFFGTDRSHGKFAT